MHTPTPIKYVPKKIDGVLMWAPIYKKGEGPSVPTTRSKKRQPVPEKKVEVKKNHVPPGFLKRYAKEHKEAKKGILVNGTCRICNEAFKYTKSKASMPRRLCSAVCAYQAQKDFNKAYEEKKKITAVKGVQPGGTKFPARKVIQNTKKTTLCKGCGKSFQWRQEGRHAPRKFCKARCRLDYWAKQRSAARSRVDDAKEAKKSFVERVAEHLPPTLPPSEMKETIAPARPVSQPPSWEILVEEASNMGIELDKEPARAQSFYIALLMARRAHHHEEWKRLLKSQNVRIRQLPETYMALKSVSGEGAIASARALKTRMGM